jgi:hypothetical protein
MDHSVGYSLHRIYCRQMLWTMIYNIKQNEFDKKRTNFLPISFWQMRSTERQSAIGLLEAMQENK